MCERKQFQEPSSLEPGACHLSKSVSTIESRKLNNIKNLNYSTNSCIDKAISNHYKSTKTIMGHTYKQNFK